MRTIHSTNPRPSLASVFSGKKQGTPEHRALVKQSQRLVSNTFFGAILKQMRQSPFKSKLFDGGRGGEAFGSLLDQHLADRMASGSGAKLANAIANKYEKIMAEKPGDLKQARPVSPNAMRMLLKKSGYSKSPAVNRRPYVAADIRA